MSLDVTHLAGPLWIGSHPPIQGHRCGDHPLEANPALVPAEGFEVLVLCAEEWQPGPEHFPGVEVVHAPFDDDHQGLDARQKEIAFQAARRTAKRLQEGKKTLVTCWAGRNRSGLVSALALSAVGDMTPAQAGELIRSKRLGALTNMSFRSLLSRLQLRKGACELCEAKPITRRYHEDAVCWVADCAQCGVPMAVYKVHGTMPPPAHLDHMLGVLQLCGRPRRGGYVLDDSMNTIPDHYHVHLRPA